jgi:hypothetical protein
MPHEEFVGWQEYYGIEPWGSGVIDAAQANIAQLLANVNRDTKARRDPYRLDEFLLLKEPKARKADEPILLDDPDAQTEAMIQAMFGGKVERA